MWKLKVIDNPINEIGERLMNGFGTLHADTSKQDTDVEDLEEQVIDDQTKQQQQHVEVIKQQVGGGEEGKCNWEHKSGRPICEGTGWWGRGGKV